ncbi:MAG TPA: ATP-binding protein [Crinalium sp.]|jgi:signal transduction histidine kinase/DNA-binding response OmpR family regulator
MLTLLTLEIRYEQDVVLTRQQARQIAERLGFDAQDQVRLATAVSEMARNVFQYAGAGTVEFLVDEEPPQVFLMRICDRGPGITNLPRILTGQYTSPTGMGQGILGSKRLMDRFEIETAPGQGTTVLMGKTLPQQTPGRSGVSSPLTREQLTQIQQNLAERSPQNPYEEIQRQNQELLHALAELRKREEELTQLNRELEDTNRGVVALYAELDEKADSLQKANELKTRFLSNMSHEFRTPLNSIVSLSRILLSGMDGQLAAEQEKQVGFIQKAAEELSELVNDLLDLAKVEAGKIVVHPSSFDVSDLFGTLRGMLRPLLEHNASIALVFEEPVGIPSLLTDEGKVAQVLRNFISNALKFTERGEVRVSAVVANELVTFSVADTGIGIAPTDQERIFEDFVQIDSQLQKQVKGTGLGLPLSRKLAELLGGNVSIHSEVGRGSTFSITIPIVYPGAAQTDSLAQPNWQFDPTRAPILVVEDEADTLLIYEKYFERSAYQLIAAQTLDEANHALQVFRPIAIILDILLKDQPTWSFLSELKENDATKNIPILVVTVVDNEKRAIALGADGFLVKPVDRLPLLNKLNTLVRGSHQQTLLLVDDDPAARYVLKQLLATTSLTILEAADGREGLRLAQVERPQAIVIDLTMPEINGSDLLEQLKHHSTTQSIPVIINTSASLAVEEQHDLAERSIAILSKDTSSQVDAIAQLQQALLQAGIVLDSGDKTHG